MRTSLLSLLFLTISVTGFADTIDYWHVYYNDSLIARFNSGQVDLNLTLDKSQIKPEDELTIRHGDDTPCISCDFKIKVTSPGDSEPIMTAMTREHFGKISFRLMELSIIGNIEEVDKFNFHYYETDRGSNGEMVRLVLQLTLQ